MPIIANSAESHPPPSAGRTAEVRLKELWESAPGLQTLLGTVDHKRIAERYLVTAFLFLIIGGIEALVIRLQLARAEQSLVTPETYDQVFTMHGVTMIFWYASPILSGFGNYLVPLMLGARDMAFPRLNAFTYWAFLFSGAFLYGSVLLGEAPHAGWFAYVPYTSEAFSPGRGIDFYAVALIFLTISTTAGAINFIVTILRHRAPGMTLGRMPLFMYSTLTTSVSIVLSLPALTAACVFLELDRRFHFHFFDPARGGSVLLWQHLFWFFGHPWVYVIFLPATGMISMLLPVFSRRPIVGYPYVAASTVLTGVVGFSVWIHHMFAAGVSHVSMNIFSAASMTISVFSTVQVFAWVATLWRGRPVLTTSLLFAVGFLVSLVVGGLSGVVTAVVPFDWQVTDTYFVVAHLHYVLVGANVFPVFAAFYYWLPKITGKKLDEQLGRWSFGLMFAGFNLTFFPMHIAGALGMRRRVFTYPEGQGWEGLNLAASVGAVVLAAGILVSVWNYFVSQRRGAPAGKNPWNADTLEWSTDSPPAVYGTVHLPTVRTRHPLWDDHDEERDPDGARILDEHRTTLSTTWRDAEPVAVAKMPDDSLAPLAASLTLLALAVAVVAKSLGVMVAAALATAIVAATWLRPRPQRVPRTPLGEGELRAPLVTAIDQARGEGGMALFIATEAALFVMLFFTYFYLGPYSGERPPDLAFALPMLGILLVSSAVLHWGEARLKESGDAAPARLAVIGTLLLGVAFVVLQAFEYREQLRELAPQTSAYGSIFYTMTGIHGLHVLLGMGMLARILFLARLGDSPKPPHHALRNASRYWHFVDLVWVAIVGIVYVAPHLTR
jgi:cytochrome c oxidase subunit I+III